MTDDARRDRTRDIRTFAAGAGCGLLAGIFLVSIIVWQFGNVIGTRAAGVQNPAHAPNPMARWNDRSAEMDDVGPAVLERADDQRPTGTTGTDAPPVAAA